MLNYSMMTAVALCAIGAEKALSNELRKIELPILSSSFGKVRFQADLEGLYRALMALRTADRVLLEAATFQAADFEALFEGTQAVAWEELIPKGWHVVVSKIRTNRSALSATTSIQSVVHKAIADRLCSRWRVSRLSEDGEVAEIRVYIEKDVASLLLDLSGEPLFRRGYRSEGGAAPLRETTAAAIILLMGWKRKFPLYDPFCGSGTLATEAALYAWDAAPGLGRSFVLSKLVFGDAAVESRVRGVLAEKVDFTRTIRIEGSDADPRAVSIARSNAERAFELAKGVVPGRGIRLLPEGSPSGGDRAALPSFRLLPMESARAPYEEGFIVTNPPYGERLGDLQEAERGYASMRRLEENFPNWTLAIITNHPGFESHFGRAANSAREITNGAMRSFLYIFDHLGRRNNVDRRRAR